MTQIRAIQIERYGPPEVLVCRDVALAPVGHDDIRIRTVAAAINHTDLKIRAGIWPVHKSQPFPYTPGVEVVGTVTEVGAGVTTWKPGDQAITMMQGLGGVRAERSGGYADFVTVAAAAAAAIPLGYSLFDIAALGLPAVTAHQALVRMGPLSGKRLLVTGAAGQVGSAAIALGDALGATVTAVVSKLEDVDHVLRKGADHVVVVAKEQKANFPAEAFDAVLETAAGHSFKSSVEALAADGTLCLVGAVAGADIGFDAWQLIRPVRLTGYSTESLSGADLAHTLEALLGWLDIQTLSAPRYRLIPMEEAGHAHALLEHGNIKERLLLAP
ncbi:NADPH2:quinone reductase [Pseudoxanthomonas sp. GM95]|uniref:quinone oxidoreductase family protein n=1 Tax=Pseudoxanthomonas sp. GM95 TaxID=1881043 RepID=UPI0008CD88D1|nr:zinc-binding alcohol dehydrogenase family protein [Pseudoxanthomonas sp. GM95]SEM54563.1 NADPH2:quinone reductase [Pseudoxanthomonas sp. GM95]